MRIAGASLIALLTLPAGFAAARPQAAQQQPEKQPSSVTEAARRTREKAQKAARAWDNDSVPTAASGVSVVGAAAAPAAASAPAAPAASQGQAPAPGASAGGAAKVASDKTAGQAELDSAKERLKTLTAELDVLSRQLALDQRLYYGKPNYASDREGQQKVEQEQSQVDLKRQEVAEAQKKVDELQAKLGPPAANAPTPN